MKSSFRTNEILAEQFHRVKFRQGHGGVFDNDHHENEEEKPLYYIFIFTICLVFLFLIGRIYTLQVVGGDYYKNLSEKNRILEKVLPAPRGIIFDRNNEVITHNVPRYRQKIDESHYKLVDRDTALKIEIKGGSELSKLDTIIGREYPYKEITAHLIGYIGEVTEEEIKNSVTFCLWEKKRYCDAYLLGDFSGKTGLEKYYENILKGKPGKELIEVDANGKKLRSLGKIEPKAGKDISLSLDINLQKAAYNGLLEVIDNKRSTAGKVIKGAVVISNPQSGEIMGLVSTPSFNPEIFVRYKEADDKYTDSMIGGIFEDENLPLFNRAIGGIYPPGSTFKIISAVAGLESGKITESTFFEDIGMIKIGPYEFPNWAFLKSGAKDGMINLVTAIKRSNDIYFYKLGETIGLSGLSSWANKFGLGNTLGIDLDGEAKGLVPSEKWKQENIKDNWYLGDTYHLAIGQGYLLTTPLQVNTWTNVIAGNGKLCRPHLVNILSGIDYQYMNNYRLLSSKDENCKEIGIKGSTIRLVREGMEAACNTGGTAWPLFNFMVKSSSSVEPKKVNLACKTGTAEYGDPEERTHAWFTVFAPADKPEISVTVLVEGGGEGSDVSTLVAKKVLEEWFGR